MNATVSRDQRWRPPQAAEAANAARAAYTAKRHAEGAPAARRV
jgi:hypothetical protein